MRRLVEFLIVFSVALAAIASLAAFYIKGLRAAEAWAVVAGALAVITSALSAWAAHRMVVMQDEARQPEVRVQLETIDLGGGKDLNLTNAGSMTAWNISVAWEKPVDAENPGSGDQQVGHLLPGEEWGCRLPRHFAGNDQEFEAKASVQWENESGRRFKCSFVAEKGDIEGKQWPQLRREADTGMGLQQLLRRELDKHRRESLAVLNQFAGQLSSAFRPLRR